MTKPIIERAKQVFQDSYGEGHWIDVAVACLDAAHLLNDPVPMLTAEEVREIAAKALHDGGEYMIANAMRAGDRSFGATYIAVNALVGHIQRGGLTEEQTKEIKKLNVLKEEIKSLKGQLADIGVEKYGLELLQTSFNWGHTRLCAINAIHHESQCTCGRSIIGRLIVAENAVKKMKTENELFHKNAKDRNGLTPEQTKDLERWEFVNHLQWYNKVVRGYRYRCVDVPIDGKLGGNFAFAVDAAITESKKPKPITPEQAKAAIDSGDKEIVRKWIEQEKKQ
jgi:hypothetical protein